MTSTPKFWRSKNLISALLSPLSLLYLLISTANFHLRAPRKFKTKIICIGNAIAGGAGKTPTAIMLGKFLIKHHYKVAYVCKNYLATIKGPVQVSIHHTTPDIVDEGLLLAKIADTFVANNMLDALLLADKGDYDFIITDDGLQNNTFQKDLSILVIDGEIGFGNNLLIPAGPLREPVDRIVKKVDLVFIIGTDKRNRKHTITHPHIIQLTPKFKLIKTKTQAQHYIAFSGIAYPEKFFSALKENKLKVVETISYPDHTQYSKERLETLMRKAQNINSTLITTEKDFVKIPIKYHAKIALLKMELIAKNNKIILNLINKIGS